MPSAMPHSRWPDSSCSIRWISCSNVARSAGSLVAIAFSYAASNLLFLQPASFWPESETMVLLAKNTTESFVPQYVVYRSPLSQVFSQNAADSCLTTSTFTPASRTWEANSVAASARPAMSSVVSSL